MSHKYLVQRIGKQSLHNFLVLEETLYIVQQPVCYIYIPFHFDSNNNNTPKKDIMSAEEAEFIDVSIAQDGGVQKKILEAAPEGALGPPPNGNEVEAHYTGT